MALIIKNNKDSNNKITEKYSNIRLGKINQKKIDTKLRDSQTIFSLPQALAGVAGRFKKYSQKKLVITIINSKAIK